MLSIKSLRIRTRADKPELLDVTFTVSSFEPDLMARCGARALIAGGSLVACSLRASSSWRFP